MEIATGVGTGVKEAMGNRADEFTKRYVRLRFSIAGSVTETC